MAPGQYHCIQYIALKENATQCAWNKCTGELKHGEKAMKNFVQQISNLSFVCHRLVALWFSAGPPWLSFAYGRDLYTGLCKILGCSNF
jgi:hypothetical protein